MKQKIKPTLYPLLILVLIFLSGCFKTKLETDDVLPISNVVNELLEIGGISDSYIVSLKDYSDIKHHLYTPEYTDEDFEQYFNDKHSGFDTLTDELVKKEFYFDSLEAYKVDQRRQYFEHLKISQILQARVEIFDELISRSKFLLSDEDVAVLSRNVVTATENEGLLFGYFTLEEYVTEGMQMTMDQFMEDCVQRGRRKLCECLLIGYIAQKENLQVDSSISIDDQFQELENLVFDLFIETDEDY